MLKFIGGFEVDPVTGNSRGVRLSDGEIAVRLAQEQAQVSHMAASSAIIGHVQAAIAAGRAVRIEDLDLALEDKTLAERMVIKTDLRRRNLIVDGTVVEQVEAACSDVMAMVEPHADRLEAAADEMSKAGIGLHATDGHVSHIRRIAGSLRAAAAEGRVAHRYDGGLSRWD
jgi:hypothetical protein